MFINILFDPSERAHSAHIIDTAMVNLASLRRDLKRRKTQPITDTSARTQYVWQCEMLIKVCEDLENANDICLNTVFWYIPSSNAEEFTIYHLPAKTIYKIIAPDLEYWYAECPPMSFAGVQKRPDAGHRPNQPMRPYYHCVQECSMNDLPCSKWKSCSVACDDQCGFGEDTKIGIIYNKLRGMCPTKRPTLTGTPPEMLPDDFDEMPTPMNGNDIAGYL